MYAAVATRTLGQQIKLALVAALLMLSLAVGMAATTQRVDAKPRTHCIIIENPVEWEVITGYKADPDFVGGMLCGKS